MQSLASPFSAEPEEISPRDKLWLPAFAFYMEVIGRSGVPMSIVDFNVTDFKQAVSGESDQNEKNTLVSYLMSLQRKPMFTGNVSDFYLAPRGVRSINHELHFFNPENAERALELDVCKNLLGGVVARSLILTGETLAILGRQVAGSQRLVADLFANISWSSLTNDAKGHFKTLLQWFVDYTSDSRLHATRRTKDTLMNLFHNLPDAQFRPPDDFKPRCTTIAITGRFSTFPMGITSRTHLLHPAFHMEKNVRDGLLSAIRDDSVLESTAGFLSFGFLEAFDNLLRDNRDFAGESHPFTSSWHTDRLARTVMDIPDDVADPQWDAHWAAFVTCLSERFTGNGIDNRNRMLRGVVLKDTARRVIPGCDDGCKACTLMTPPSRQLWEYLNKPSTAAVAMVPSGVDVDLGKLFSASDQEENYDGTYHAPPRTSTGMNATSDEVLAADTEFVIIRPNIEHNMLGIILGLAGSELGHTFWGQTELSCYDDSMHGIWGMSYKYHERAIVFNEKNLVRLWDIAYDGYNGGKDDTHVDWYEPGSKNGYKKFGEATMDLGSSYRGPSMMVMKFTHTDAERREPGSGYQRNWPSPIVFHEPEEADDGGRRGASLSVDQENLHVVDVDEFRVFHEKLYKKQYGVYRAMMPHFQDNHRTRKSAGEASAESETQSTCLAFQGSMRIKEGGKLIQEIQGSGHHGPDYVGVASVRAGKGIKYTGQAPTFSHMV
jgi:hypothetical protein